MNAPQFQLAVQIPTIFIGSRITEGELEDKVHAAIFGLGKFDGITSDEAETDVFVYTVIWPAPPEEESSMLM